MTMARSGKDGKDDVLLQIRDLDAEDLACGMVPLPALASAPSSSSSSPSTPSAAPSSPPEDGKGAVEPLGSGGSGVTMLLQPVSGPPSVGSLLRFFQSMFFDSWITISYLYKFRDHAGVCDYLCNELYKFQERDIEKYIPQLCILLLSKKEKDSSLARFMMDKCAASMHFALQIAWQLQAYITYGGDRLPTTPQEKEFIERCLRLHEEVEIATVNCKSSLRLRALVDFSPFVALSELSSKSGREIENGDSQHMKEVSSGEVAAANGDGAKSNTGTSGGQSTTSSDDSGSDREDNLYKDSKTEDEDESYRKWDAVLHDEVLPQEDAMHIILGLSKRERAQYYSNVVSFVDKLIDIGEQLIQVPENQRKERLERDLRYLSEHLVDGLYLPICGATDSHHCIVRLLPSESLPLHSKARVPYLFYYEIIESREKCSAPNLHSFNLEAARLGAGVPSVLSPFDEPESPEEARTKPNSSSNNHSKSRANMQKAKTVPSIHAESPLTPTKRVKETSIVRKMGFYTEQNLASLAYQQEGNAPGSPFDERDHRTGREADEVDQRDSDEDQGEQSDEENGSDRPSHEMYDPSRSESDAAMLEKLYGMGRKSDESDNEEERKADRSPAGEDTQPSSSESAHDPQTTTIVSDNNKTDEISLNSIFGESWKDKENRIRKESPFSHLPNWKLAAVIVKSGDDLRQEQLASQLLTHLKEIFENAMLPLFLYPLRILVTSADSGLIELIPDSISLHQLKKRTNCMSLAHYFRKVYTTQEAFDKARLNFVESMAAYSLACYLLQVKDRHNGNIMIDSGGHIIHIDYGFFIFNSPGSLNFESAPFKLTPEFMEVMGGPESKLFAYFKDLLFRGFMEARKYREKIILILEIWLLNSKYNTSVLPCLAGGKAAVDALAERFKLGYTEKECREFVDQLIQYSLGNWRTREYDRFQFLTRGVLYSS